MKVTSSSIVDGRIAKPCACRTQGGSDQTPQLTVDDIPSEAKYLCIVGDDPDAMKPAGKVWVHWNVFNVPVTGRFLADAGQKLTGDAGRTSGGASGGYEGPCPPDGMHTYRFAVFATRDKLPVDTQAEWTIDAFEAKFGPQVLDKAVLTGQFG
jgi:Raf kinase inhibitor-like YbhB/YbcL family protein